MEYYLIFKRNKEQIHSTRYILLSNGMLSETSKQKTAQIILLHFMKISSIDTYTETEGSLSGQEMGGNGERLLNADVVCFLC